jgi:hypothetical protein
MGKCIYCGNPAGFFRKKHNECVQKYLSGQKEIKSATLETIMNNGDFELLKQMVHQIANENYIEEGTINRMLASGFNLAVNNFLEDGILSEEEEEKAGQFQYFFKLPQEIINKNGALEKVNKAAILRELVNGKLPESRIIIDGNLPFNFQKGEKLIWLFQNVEFHEQRIKTSFRGVSRGVSVKIMKGVYYRTGLFQGNPVRTAEMTFMGVGLMALTNKNIYFASSSKSLKIPYNKIITFEPYEDGLGLQKDGVSAKPQIFKNIDGWFAYNVVQNISKVD